MQDRAMSKERLEQDCMTLVLRLLGENPDTFSPEAAEVMDRWKPKALALLKEVGYGQSTLPSFDEAST